MKVRMRNEDFLFLLSVFLRDNLIMESLFLSFGVSVEPSNMSDMKRSLTFIFR